MSMIKKLLCAAVLAVFTVLASPVLAKDVFVVGIPVEGPWNFFQDDGEQLTGIDIDVVRTLGRESGFKFEFKPMPASRALVDLKNENIDAVAGMSTHMADTNGFPRLKNPYMAGIRQYVYQKSDAARPVQKYSHLYSHVVGIIRTFSYFDELDDDPLIVKDYSDDPEIQFGKLLSGELDVVVASEWEAAYYMATHKLERHTFVPAAVNLENHRCDADRVMAFGPSFDRGIIRKLQRTLDVLVSDGLVESIADSYRTRFLETGAAAGEAGQDSGSAAGKK